MFCNVLDLESCVFLVSPYKHNANTVLNFIIETGFRNPGIRNPEITRVYNERDSMDRIEERYTQPGNNRVFCCCYPKYVRVDYKGIHFEDEDKESLSG